MKILVMGSGAVGGCYGGLLAKAGEDVVFVARGAHLEAIKRDGLRVESATMGDFVVHPKALMRENRMDTPLSHWLTGRQCLSSAGREI